MVLPLALGAGLALGGAALGAVGANKAGKAQIAAAQQQQRNAQGLASANQGANERALTSIQDLIPAQNDVLDQRIAAFGPVRREGFQAGQDSAGETLAAARAQLAALIPQTIPQSGYAGTTAMQAERTQQARSAPASDLRQMSLADLLSSYPVAQAQSQTADDQALIARQLGEIGTDQTLAQILAARQFGTGQSDVSRRLFEAGFSGGLERSLGGLAMGLAPGVAAATSRPVPAAAPTIGGQVAQNLSQYPIATYDDVVQGLPLATPAVPASAYPAAPAPSTQVAPGLFATPGGMY